KTRRRPSAEARRRQPADRQPEDHAGRLAEGGGRSAGRAEEGGGGGEEERAGYGKGCAGDEIDSHFCEGAMPASPLPLWDRVARIEDARRVRGTGLTLCGYPSSAFASRRHLLPQGEKGRS